MNKNMFTRDFDLKLEDTNNRYAACRAISRRARNVNADAEQHLEDDESVPSEPNPAVTALADYAEGRINLADEEQE